MGLRYNEKGKYFTDRITKDAIPFVIQTLLHRIEGNLHVRKGERVRDGINKDDQFVAVTEAVVYTIQGNHLHETDLLLVNKAQIIWMSPVDTEDPE